MSAPRRLLREDGDVDHEAVRIAASGQRQVRLTPTERILALRLMLRDPHLTLSDVQYRLSIHASAARVMLAAEGCDVVKAGGRWKSQIIVRRPGNS